MCLPRCGCPKKNQTMRYDVIHTHSHRSYVQFQPNPRTPSSGSPKSRSRYTKTKLLPVSCIGGGGSSCWELRWAVKAAGNPYHTCSFCVCGEIPPLSPLAMAFSPANVLPAEDPPPPSLLSPVVRYMKAPHHIITQEAHHPRRRRRG